jgi:hypothetical protein
MKLLKHLGLVVLALALLQQPAAAMTGETAGLNHRLMGLLWHIQNHFGRSVTIVFTCVAWRPTLKFRVLVKRNWPNMPAAWLGVVGLGFIAAMAVFTLMWGHGANGIGRVMANI